ncbi:MAG: 3-oxoadipate enol-lactonase [Pyrinomonadaceae bacterium]
MAYAQIKDLQLYYEIHGDGQPLILLPGIGTGAWTWFKQLPAFAQKFRTVIFDPRGVARSDKPKQSFTMRTLADDVAGLLEALSIEKAHVLGTSFGGFVTQEFAFAFPHKTASLILCCTSFGGMRHIPPAPEVLRAMTSSEGLGTKERIRRNLTPAFSTQFIAGQSNEFERFIKMRIDNPIADYTYLNQLQSAMTFDAESRLAAIQSPTLVITGDQDKIVPPENSRNLAAQIPHAKLVFIEDGSHIFFVERADEFNRAVIDFIEEVD